MVSAKFLVLLLCALAALFAAAPVAEAKGKVMPAICFDCGFLHISVFRLSSTRDAAAVRVILVHALVAAPHGVDIARFGIVATTHPAVQPAFLLPLFLRSVIHQGRAEKVS
jgi:hypothetical protein